MKKAQRNKVIFGAASVALLTALFLGMLHKNLFSTIHLKFSNFLYFAEENQASEDIVLVAIDDKSFEIANASELGTLQFDKADYAKVIENLNAAGASVIGVDVIFSEATTAADERVLVEALERHDNVILAAEPKTPQTTGLKPLPAFADVRPENLGGILFQIDKDNIARRQSLLFEDEVVPYSFSLQIIKKYLNLFDEDSQVVEGGFELVPFATRVGAKKYEPITIPTKNDRMIINFFGEPYSYERVSFADAHTNDFGELDLSNKIILIGEMGTGIHDEQYVPVSFGQAMPGVEIHANTIQTILSQRFLVDQSRMSRSLTIFAVVLVGMTLFLILNVWASVLVFLIGIMAYTFVTWIVFEYGIILNTFYPHLALFVTLVVAYIYRYFTEARALMKTEHAFGRYVSETVVKKILENPGELKLGGHQKTLTVFFSDIADFTTISEKMTPPALVKHLNEYLDAMSAIILKHEGTLDKFVGDAIVAFWGAPITQPKHAERACMAALEYMEALDKLNAEWKKKKKPVFKARIGIHTGKMIVGNVGSSRRFDYTVIGDSVNLGSRLEGKNKDFGTSVLISEDTFKLVKDKFEAREIGLISVKGKKKKVRAYELIGLKKKA